jgi:pimeloyl-ACP methyl ester carboxylesterase
MTTFALVHGAWHSGSCWDSTATLLRAAGHPVVAPDLPCDDPAATLADYRSAVLDSLAPHPSDDLVLVGHSLGGVTIPLVAEARPVRALVFVCALLPLPGVALSQDQLVEEGLFAPEWPALASRQVRAADGSSTWPPDAAIEAFCHDCRPDVAARAVAALRPQHWGMANEPSPLHGYPEVPATAVVCAGDRVLAAESCARLAEERLGATVIRLGGGHNPMQAQPERLAQILLELT